MCYNIINIVSQKLVKNIIFSEGIMLKKAKNISNTSGEKYLAAFLMGAGCLLFSLLPIMLVENGYFIYGGDYNSQQINFYHSVNVAVRNGEFGWHWFTDLGSDLMTSYSFYLFGSPFFWLSTLLPIGAVTYAMPVLLAVKHGLAAMTAYAYIRRFVRSKEASLIGGLLYAFSGFQIYNIFFNHFQDVTAFFPLMLIAIEELINKNRRGIFALTVAFMALLNYYFFAGQAVFLIFYYLFRMKCPDFHTSWKKFACLAFEAVIGTAIAAVILLPSALAIMGNYRITQVSYGADMVLYSDKTTIPRIIQSFFMPSDPPSCPILFDSDYHKWASIAGYFPLFSMAGVAAFMKGKKKHWASRFSVFCIICAFIPILNSLFQAFNFYYYARWFYMPILIFAMMTAQSLDDEESDLGFGLNICAIAVFIFAVIGMLPTKEKNGSIRFFMLPNDPIYFWVTIIVAAIGLECLKHLIKRRRLGKPFMKNAVIMTLIASVVCIFTTVFYDAYDIKSAKQYISANINGGGDVYEKVSDDNFFRIDFSYDNDNNAMYWGIPSMKTFHSVVNTSIMEFYHALDIPRDVSSNADISHYALRGLFSVKYYYRELADCLTRDEIKKNPQSLPSSSDNEDKFLNADVEEHLHGFEYVGSNENFEIYQNKLYIPMGFAYDSFISEQNAEKLSAEKLERLLIDSVVLSSEQINKYSDILIPNPTTELLTKEDYVDSCLEKQKNSSSSFEYDSKGFESVITLDKPQLVFFSVPYSEGWSAEVNGKPADVEKVSMGFMAVRADEGTNTIVFRYKTPGLTTGFIITVIAVILLIIYLVVMKSTKTDDKYPPHTHYYDYNTTAKPSAHTNYCGRFGRK